jgi:acetolactate synthase-1/2/3 large subunit
LLYDFEGIRHILVRQEAAAGHAAEGYSRTTGKTGVCLVTSGPAATNWSRRSRMPSWTPFRSWLSPARLPTHLIGNDAFQEADNVGITRSATKHNFLVKDGNDLAMTIKEAFHIASSGRPGPVHVDLPKDILVKEWSFDYPDKVHLRSYNPTYEGHPGQIRRQRAPSCGPSAPCSTWGAASSSSDGSPELYELAELTQVR